MLVGKQRLYLQTSLPITCCYFIHDVGSMLWRLVRGLDHEMKRNLNKNKVSSTLIHHFQTDLIIFNDLKLCATNQTMVNITKIKETRQLKLLTQESL